MWISVGWWCVSCIQSDKQTYISGRKIIGTLFQRMFCKNRSQRGFFFSLKIVLKFLTNYINIAIEDFN